MNKSSDPPGQAAKQPPPAGNTAAPKAAGAGAKAAQPAKAPVPVAPAGKATAAQQPAKDISPQKLPPKKEDPKVATTKPAAAPTDASKKTAEAPVPKAAEKAVVEKVPAKPSTAANPKVDPILSPPSSQSPVKKGEKLKLEESQQIDSTTKQLHEQLDMVKDTAKQPPFRKQVTFEEAKEGNKVSPSKPAPGPSGSPKQEEQSKLPGAQPAVQAAEPNKFSLSGKDQLKLFKMWVQNMKSFKLFKSEKLPKFNAASTKMYGVWLKAEGFQMPVDYKDAKYLASVQINCTLCDPSAGLYGRTAILKSNQSTDEWNPQPLNQVKFDTYLLFHTDLDLKQTGMVCEISVNIHDVTKNNKIVDQIGFGIFVCKMCAADKTLNESDKAKVLLATPRPFVMFLPNQTIDSKMGKLQPSKKGYEVNYHVKEFACENPKNKAQILELLSPNCLVSPEDLIPGIQGSRLNPQFHIKNLENVKFEERATIFAHNIQIENLGKVEKHFQKFLNDQTAGTGFSPTIVERQLSCDITNSCRLKPLEPFEIKVKKGTDKQIHVENPKEAMEIYDIPVNSMTCLIFKMVYRVRYAQQGKLDEATFKSFTLGRHAFFPKFDFTGQTKDRLVSIDLTKSPLLSMLSETVWDCNEKYNQGKPLYIKLQMNFANSMDLSAEQAQQSVDDKKLEAIMSKNKAAAGALDKKALELAEMQIKMENMKKDQNVREQKEQLIKQKQLQAEEELKQLEQLEQEERAKVEKQQELERQENEKKKLIAKIEQQKSEQHMKQVQESNQAIKQLMELLQSLLEQKKDDEEDQQKSISKLTQQIMRLTENADEDMFQQNAIFAKSGKFKAAKFGNFSAQDMEQINEQIDKERSRGEIAEVPQNYHPNLNIELRNPFNANNLSIKFIALKTPQNYNRSILYPQRVYFTCKFFTFEERTTAPVFLRLSKKHAANLQHQERQQEIQAQNAKANPQGQLLANTQYFLMQYTGVPDSRQGEKPKDKRVRRRPQDDIDEEYEGMNNGMELEFEISAQQKYEVFARYLHEKHLTIDIWNGDSQMHFGSCKVPLYLLMLQDEGSKVVGQQFDIIEQEHANVLGGLQLVVTNTGLKIKEEGAQTAKDGTVGSKVKKMVYSSAGKDNMYKSQILQEEAKAQVEIKPISKTMTADERKRMRVERLKAQKMIQTQSDDFRNDYAKYGLKEIQEKREKQKQDLFKNLTLNIQKGHTVYARSGEPHLFELETNNPYDKQTAFAIDIEDEDYKSKQIKAPELVLVNSIADATERKEWFQYYDDHFGGLDYQVYKEHIKVGGEFNLKASQKVKLIFKFQSYRQPMPEDGENIDYATQIRKRDIKLQVRDGHDVVVQQALVDIQPSEMQLDQVFRYYEPEKKRCEAVVPNFMPGKEDLANVVVHCTNPKVKIETKGNVFHAVVGELGAAKSVEKAYVFIYRDKYMIQLIGSCRVEINSLMVIAFSGMTDEQYEFPLKVVNPSVQNKFKDRTIELFSTDPQLVYKGTVGAKRNLYTLSGEKGKVQTIDVCIKAKQEGKNRARVNVVDINSSEVLMSYLFEVEATKPKIKATYTVTCTVDQPNTYNIEYKNPAPQTWQKPIKLQFTSSDPDLIFPESDEVVLGPLGTNQGQAQLVFCLPAQTEVQTKEAMIHVEADDDPVGGQAPPKILESLQFIVDVQQSK